MTDSNFDEYSKLVNELLDRGIKVGDVLECEGGRVLEHNQLKAPVLKVQLWSIIDGTGPRWFVRQVGFYRGTTAFVPDLSIDYDVPPGTRFEVVKVSRMSVVLKMVDNKPLFPYKGEM
jgi:hypothetical protein